MDDDAIATRLRERIAASAFHRDLGLEVLEASPGVVRLSMPAREDQRNLLGSIHGGILATLADIAMGLAVRTDAGEERRHTTIDLDIRFLRGAGPGTLTAEGRTVRVGSRIAVAEARIASEEGVEVARASGTYDVAPHRS
jgi:uncharacterized protein (TIGR00369 family)